MSFSETRNKKSNRKKNSNNKNNSSSFNEKNGDIYQTEDYLNSSQLQNDYEFIIKCLKDKEIPEIVSLIGSSDMKYFLINNDLDYNLFRYCIIYEQSEGINELIKAGYKFNTDTLLIELYDCLLEKKNNGEKMKEYFEDDIFNESNMEFIITYNNGELINKEKCIVEFYFLLLCNEFDLATTLLEQDYTSYLRDYFNQIFIGDESNLLKHLLMNHEIVKNCVKNSLIRKLDGIAFEILNFSGFYLDQEILRTAVEHDCHLFLEEVWTSSRKFGNIRNFYAPKISFSKYIENMLEFKKFEMASDAIKNWFEVYKEENVFDILLEKGCEELLIDLIDTASTYNYKIEFDHEDFEKIIKEFYFLLKVILGKPIYKKFVNSEEIQQYLVDPLRKGQTILPAIECYNTIDDHLLAIQHIEHAGLVLLDFLKQAKKFTFCRYPLLLCCLVCEFMNKLKIRFPVYESFFDQIFNGYVTAGKLFVSRIKDDNILEYHLNRKDLKNRTCLQIMSQNRLYSILDDNNIGAIIGKYWGGNTVQYGLYDCSSFTYIMRYNITSDLIHRKNFTKEYNNLKHFVFNYNSFRDTVSTRYYFKEFYNVILVIIYQLMIYFCVLDKSLENTINHYYPALQTITFYGSLALVLNKISSLIFFSLVNRWYIEIDNHLGEIIFTITLFIHFLNLKQWFVPKDDLETNELINAVLLSYQIGYQWYRVIDGLKATKMYGGFLRTVFVLIKKMFLLVCFFYCFILLCTGVFNLLFHQYRQFQTYFNSFFYLAQAALQQYDLDVQWTKFLNFSLMIVMIISTLILMNLIIALATKIYDDVDEHIEPEHRGNLIKIYEYLRYDENYGIFKFVSSPFNILAIPFMVLILFVDDKKYWGDIFTRIIYFPVAFLFYVIFMIINTYRLLYLYLHQLIMVPIRYEFNIKTYSIILFLGPFLYSYYYVLDLIYFWYYAYKKQKQTDKETTKAREKILEFRELFSMLIYDISETIEKDKKNKKLSIGDLVSGWLENLNSKIPKKGSEENNRMHKKSLIQKKYRNSTICLNPNDINYRSSHATIFRNINNKISITEHLSKIFTFLVRFADREGFIDKELAKNIFPKRNYYDDEYFEYLYYFKYKYFKSIISRFIKNNNEERKEMNKLRGVLTDIQKINEKFNVLKFNLKNIPKKNLSVLSSGISTINTTFAILENNLLDAQTKEIYKRMWMTTNNKDSSSLQKQKQAASLMNKLQDPKDDIKLNE